MVSAPEDKSCQKYFQAQKSIRDMIGKMKKGGLILPGYLPAVLATV